MECTYITAILVDDKSCRVQASPAAPQVHAEETGTITPPPEWKEQKKQSPRQQRILSGTKGIITPAIEFDRYVHIQRNNHAIED